MTKVNVQFYSDILCVWAYIGQTRLDELCTKHGGDIELHFHFMSIFGDVFGKIERGWSERGGLQAYNEHVQKAGAGFPEIEIHSECWTKNTPASSLPCHLMISAMRHLAQHDECDRGLPAKAIRRAREKFFQDADNIAEHKTLMELTDELDVSAAAIERCISSGSAHAKLARDLELVRDHRVQTSPTFSFNQWRQRLEGNVGYRLIEANVKELIERPSGQASWC